MRCAAPSHAVVMIASAQRSASLSGVSFSDGMRRWLCRFPTWEGGILQVAAVVFVGGRYVAAEWIRRRELRQVRAQVQVQTASASATNSGPR